MRAYLAVAVGGLIGTGLRLVFDLAFAPGDGEFPVETLVVNLVGSFVLGWLAGGLWTRPSTPRPRACPIVRIDTFTMWVNV